MEAKQFHRLLGCACALYFIGSAGCRPGAGRRAPVRARAHHRQHRADQRRCHRECGRFVHGAWQSAGWLSQRPAGVGPDLESHAEPGPLDCRVSHSHQPHDHHAQLQPRVLAADHAGIFAVAVRRLGHATLVDANGDLSAAIAPIAISPSIYRGTIDGITVLSLLAANVSCSRQQRGLQLRSGTDDYRPSGADASGSGGQQRHRNLPELQPVAGRPRDFRRELHRGAAGPGAAAGRTAAAPVGTGCAGDAASPAHAGQLATRPDSIIDKGCAAGRAVFAARWPATECSSPVMASSTSVPPRASATSGS